MFYTCILIPRIIFNKISKLCILLLYNTSKFLFSNIHCIAENVTIKLTYLYIIYLYKSLWVRIGGHLLAPDLFISNHDRYPNNYFLLRKLASN